MNMIEKDAVLHMIDINIEPHVHGEWDSGYNVALSEIREKIKQMPTIEAEPDKGWVIDKLKDKLNQAFSNTVNDAQDYWNPRVAQDALQDAYSNVSCWIDEILNDGEEAQK